MGYSSAYTGLHAKRLELQKMKLSSFQQQQFWTLDDDHIGRNMSFDVMWRDF
jgi:hypothetical protein